MSYRIKLKSFEGPLDLLLYLIQKQEIDIYDIPIAQVTEQYLTYILAMKQLDLDIASEFLVMAATLLSIKAKMLLPRPPVIEDEKGEPIDPREELVVRLLEYKKYKAAAEKLKEKELARKKLFFHPVDVEMFSADFKKINPLEGTNVWELLDIFSEVLNKAEVLEPIHELRQEEVTIGQQISIICQLIEAKSEGVYFHEIFPPETTRGRIVVTFLALLELIRLQKIIVYQNKTFSSIRILPYPEQSPEGGRGNVIFG